MLYLRDLGEDQQKDIERVIRKERPDLVPNMEKVEFDIQIGEIWPTKEFKEIQ